MPGLAALENLVGESPQVFDEGDLEHDRPGPELADRKRGDPLVTVQERRELVRIEPAVAMPEQLDGHRVDTRAAGMILRGQRRQLAIERARQVQSNVADFRADQVVVVEHPFGRRRDELAVADVIGERPIRATQDVCVVTKARKDGCGRGGCDSDRG